MPENYPGHSRKLRPGIAAIAALTTTLTLFSPVMPVALADADSTFGTEAQANIEQNVPDSTSALQWGIRGSFVRYVNGATNILDGARQGPNKSFLWPYQSTTKNPDNGEITIQYGGTVNFMKYCTGGPQRPNCDLDFTFGSPKIVLDPANGNGRLYATIHTKDYLTKQWSGPVERHIGDLDLNAGRYNLQNGKMNWKGVSATLTEEGNAAFSNFYEPGGFLDSLSFTMDEPFETTERTGYNLTNQIVTSVRYDNSNRVFVRNDGSILHVTAGSDGVVQLLDKELSSAKVIANISIKASSAAGFDPATDNLYWTDGSSIKMAHVTNDGLENITDLVSFDGEVYGFAYSTQRKAAAVLNKRGDFSNPTYKFIMAGAGGTTETDLPNPAEIDPGLDSYYEFYGSSFGRSDDGLQALPDGSFISLYDHAIRRENGDSDSAVPLHIKPDAEGNDKVALINEFSDFMTGSRGNFRGIQVDNNGNIAIYATYKAGSNKSQSDIGFAHYENGQFTVYPATAHPDALSIAGVGFGPDGNAVVISQDRSVAIFMNPKTMEEVGRASLGPYMKDTASAQNDGAVFGPDGSLYVVDNRPAADPEDWHEYVGFQRLTLPSSAQQLDPSINTYTMVGQATDGGDNNSDDTSNEEDVLPPADDDKTTGDDNGDGNTSGDNTGEDTGDGNNTGGDSNTDTAQSAEEAKKAAEEAKAAAEEAAKAAEEAKDNAAKADEVAANAAKAEAEAAKAEESAKQAEAAKISAEETAKKAAELLEKAQKAADEAASDREKAEELLAAAENAKEVAEAASEKAESEAKAAIEARNAAEQAKESAELAQKAAEEAAKATPDKSDETKPDENKPDTDWQHNFRHWLEHRGFASPLARILSFFAGILQMMIHPFIGVFGGMR